MFGKKDAEKTMNVIAAGSFAGESVAYDESKRLGVTQNGFVSTTPFNKNSIKEVRLLDSPRVLKTVPVYVRTSSDEFIADLQPSMASHLCSEHFVEYGPNGSALIDEYSSMPHVTPNPNDEKQLDSDWQQLNSSYPRMRTAASMKKRWEEYAQSQDISTDYAHGGKVFLNYVGGISILDDNVHKTSDEIPVLASVNESLGVLSFDSAPFVRNPLIDRVLHIELPLDRFVYASIIPISEEYERTFKTKNMFGRALAGGLLFGGAGAVVGAMSAGNGIATETKSKIVDFYLTLVYDGESNGERNQLMFSTYCLDVVSRQPDKQIHGFTRYLESISTTCAVSGAERQLSFRL